MMNQEFVKDYRIRIEDLYQRPHQDLIGMRKGTYIVVCPDGEMRTTSERLVIAWPSWELNRRLSYSPRVAQILPIKEYTKGTDVKMLEAAISSVYFQYIEDHPEEDPQHVYGEAMKATMAAKNLLHNYSVLANNHYANTLTAMDFYAVSNDESFIAAKVALEDSEESMLAGIDFAIREIKAERFRDNSIGKIVRTKVCNAVQSSQMFWVRGATTDIDSKIFKRSIMTSYMDGVRDVEFAAIETRQTSKAQLYQGTPMSDSEYFHRRLQLVMESHRRFVGSAPYGRDGLLLHTAKHCNTTSYTSFPVTDGKDLAALEGLSYKREDGHYQLINGDMKYLIGQTIKLRTPLDCNSKHRGHVCAACLGMYANSLPPNVDVGLYSAAEALEKIVQKVLGVKHSEGTSTRRELVLPSEESNYFHVGVDKRSFVLRHKFRDMNPSILIKPKFVPNLSDVLRDDFDIETEGVELGSIPSIEFQYTDMEGSTHRKRLHVTQSYTASHLTREMVEHIRKANFETTPKGDYLISLKGWDYTAPMFELEMKHISMVDFMKQVRTFVMSGEEQGERITMGKVLKDYTDTDSALIALHKLVKSTILVNVVHLSIMIKSMMCVGKSTRGEHSFNIPLLGEEFRFEHYRTVMLRRSVSSAMIYEWQYPLMEMLGSYDDHDRPSHPADRTFMR